MRAIGPRELHILAVAAYAAYGAAVNGANYQGLPLPPFAALSETVQDGWRAAARAVAEATADTMTRAFTEAVTRAVAEVAAEPEPGRE